jgi:hypothetical protein
MNGLLLTQNGLISINQKSLENKMSSKTEEFKVDGEKIVSKIKELIHEGNIRKFIIKDKDGKVMMEIPVTFGVAGVLLAPQLAAIGAIAALLSEATIVVEKNGIKIC